MYQVLQPTTFGGIELRNRFVRSATNDANADSAGAVTERSLEFFDKLAAGGVGLIITGFTFIAAHGQASVGQYGIHNDEMLPGLRRLADLAHSRGAKIAVQLAHCGLRSTYQNKLGKSALAVSEVDAWPFAPTPPPHRAMADAEIEAVIDDYVAAAVRARAAGFDAIQLHAAHGYLMAQFYSPITNRRADRWGGNPENRRRFHVETIRRVRAAVGADYPIWMKFGILDDDADGAGSLEEGIAALAAMRDAGLDAVEISGGIGSDQRIPSRIWNDAVTEDVYYRERAVKASRATGTPLMLVGGIRSIETAEGIVAVGDAELISLCRPLIRQPDLINRWLSGDYRRATCISCNKCLAIIGRSKPVQCGEELRLRAARRA